MEIREEYLYLNECEVGSNDIAISNAINLPRTKITKVTGFMTFWGLDSDGSLLSGGSLTIRPKDIFVTADINNLDYSIRLNDASALNEHFTPGQTVYLYISGWWIKEKIENNLQQPYQLYPSDFLYYDEGEITFEVRTDGVNNIALQSTAISNAYLGTTAVKEIRLGSEVVWSKPLTFPGSSSITHSYDNTTRTLTITLNSLCEKDQLSFEHGELYAAIYIRRLYTNTKIMNYTDTGWFGLAFNQDTLSRRGASRKYYALLKRIPLSQEVTHISLSEVNSDTEYTYQRFAEAYELTYVDFKVGLFIHKNSWPIGDVGINGGGGCWRHVPSSYSEIFTIDLTEEIDNDEYGIYTYEYTSVWSRCDGFNILFDQIVKLPSNQTGIGVQDLDFYCKFNDDYGKSKTYSNAKLYWIPATASFTTSNMKAVSEATPIPANTNVKIVAYCSSGHIKDLIEAHLEATFTTKIN